MAASGSGAPEDEVGVDAFLHGLDHIMEPSVSERPLLDDDIFSPVEKRSPPLRLPPLPSIPYRAGTQGEADAAETPLVSRRRGLSGGRQWRIMGNGEGDEPGSGEKRSGNRRVSKDGNDDVEADNCIDLDTLADICLDSKVESPKSDPASVSSVDSNSPLSRPTEEILTNNKSANSASYAMPLGRLRSNRGSEGTKRFYRKTPVKAASLGNDASIRRGEGRSGGRGEGERRGRDDGNERDGEKTKLEVMSDMHRLQTKESVDLLESEGEKTGQQLLINEIRDIMKQELDVIRSDFRSDIHNIHAEIVIMASQHSQEMKNMISDRDAMVCTLKKEVNRLRADNLRLRQKYGLH